MKYKLGKEFINDFKNQYLDDLFLFENEEIVLKIDPLMYKLDISFYELVKREISIFLDFINEEYNVLSIVDKKDTDRVYSYSFSILNKDCFYKEFNLLKNKIESILLNSLDIIENSVIDLDDNEELLFCGSVSYPKEWFVEEENENIEVKVVDVDEYSNIVKKNPQARRLKYINIAEFGRENFIYIVLLKNNKLIGANVLNFSKTKYEDDREYMISQGINILEEEKGNGYSQLILEARIKFLSENNYSLHNSSYTNEGFNYLRRNTLELAKKYNVHVKEEGLFDSPETFKQNVFDMQKKIEDKILNQEVIFFNDNIINVKENINLLKEFLNEDVENIDISKIRRKYFLLLKK